MRTLVMPYASDSAVARRDAKTSPRTALAQWHAVINAPVQDVYAALTGSTPDRAAISRMYVAPTRLRRAYAVLGSKVYVSYTLHAVPGGSQIDPRVSASPSPRSRRAALRAGRVAARQVQAELARLKDALE